VLSKVVRNFVSLFKGVACSQNFTKSRC